MKRSIIIRLLCLVLFAVLSLSLFAVPAFAENDPDIEFTASASGATNGDRRLNGSGEIHSATERCVFNFSVKDRQRGRSLSLVIRYREETVEKRAKYYILECKTKEDYGTVGIDVKEGETLLASYEVTLVFDGEDSAFTKFFKDLGHDFVRNFVDNDNYKMLFRGLGNTLIITLFALLIGIAIGTLVAAVRSTYDKNAETYKLFGGFSAHLMKALNALCKLYLTVIRGTPVVVQLLIMYFIIFAGGKHDLAVAILAFGINSGAYVAEILRGGILSVDNGQFEAGRSLGFNYIQTMRYIIIPQMFKSSLPALGNEFISLLKETSVAGYVPIIELTKAGDIIRGSTFSAFLPLIAVALIYLILVILLTKLVSLMERRLRKSER